MEIMGASRFVGRVGGLAVALGVGVGAFAGAAGVAWADDGGAGARHSSDPSSGTSTRVSRAHPASADATASGSNNRRLAPSAAVPTAVIPQISSGASRTLYRVTGTTPSPSAAVDASAEAAPVGAEARPRAISRAGAVSGLRSAAGAASSTGAGTNSLVPLSTPLAWALLAAARKPAGAALVASDLPVTYTTDFFDGIIYGSITADSLNTLTYTALGKSCGYLCGTGDIGGKLTMSSDKEAPGNFTILPYANWLDEGGEKGPQSFKVRVTETTPFDEFLTGIPLIGLLAAPVIGLLQKTPLIGSLLAPIIGASVVETIDIDVAELAADDAPVAFTYKVESFDGTLISANFFPRSELAPGEDEATLLNGPGLGSAGATDPYEARQTLGTVPPLAVLRGVTNPIFGITPDLGFNVITWDPRGVYSSGGILQLDNPNYEGLDVSALIDWAAEDTPTATSDEQGLQIGMVGGSYGGGIQMNATDPEIDAIIPTIAWNSLNESLYPSNIFKTGWANILGLFLLEARARVNQQIWRGIVTGDVFGWLSQTAQAVLGSSNTTAQMQAKTIPTLFVQGTVDALFPLAQAVQNAQLLAQDVISSMIWFCGGHGVCLDPVNPTQQYGDIYFKDMNWLNAYVKTPLNVPGVVPTFTWWDQLGDNYTSDLMPFDPDFQGEPLSETNATGGRLGILPFAIGGSGPYSGQGGDPEDPCPNGACSFPLNQVIATKSRSAVSVDFDVAEDVQIVGAPTVSFTYSGLGTSRAVYAQVVDNDTGRVLGNIATPIPLKLNGRTQTVVEFEIADIAYTAPTGGGSLTVQIVPTSNLYWNSSWGSVNISNVSVTLPTVAALG